MNPEHEVRLVQLVTNDKNLTGLDPEGRVWTYLGMAYGWAPLNMDRLTQREARGVGNQKFGERKHYG